METWDKLPLDLMDRLAESETYHRFHYRPIYSMHKWWARRPGSTFRCLGLATLSDETITKGDILTERQTGSHDGLYIDSYNQQINPDDQHINRDVTILDPFAGGGATLVELNRLGADVVGYELNPVAWWTEKKSMDDVNVDALETVFYELLEEIREELGEYYTTTDPNSGEDCEVLYYFQSQVIPCLTCDEKVQLFPRYQLAKPKKTRPGVIYCPNQNCDNRIIEFQDRKVGLDEGTKVNLNSGQERVISESGNEICPGCGHEFDPTDGTYGYGKYTCSNGHKHDVKETLDRLEEKPSLEYFAIQYVDPKGDKKYKEFENGDHQIIQDIVSETEDIFEDLPIPDQSIPIGDKTQALLNYNYSEFSELFTKRHLITYGKLFQKAIEIRESDIESEDERNISEFIITAISNSLEYNSKLTKWHYGIEKAMNTFNRHAYIPRVQPVEGNPLNSQQNTVALENFFDKVFEGKKYCQRPFEKVKNQQSGEVEQFYVDSEEIREDNVIGLRCKTSENLEEQDNSVDYIITDPPYYDNVQYSELSDYFYVWLRECLSSQYEEFTPELVPKAREIVANQKAGKNEEFFIDSLSNVFTECHRVLKSDGEMVFTYHHNENEAWSVILESIIHSGFTVTGAYPVQSEMPNNPHISDLDNAEYDILIFANKESVDDQISLHKLQENLHFELQDIIDEERERHEELSEADLGVILRGKCMYYYSKHHPHVYHDGEQVSVNEALNAVDEIIQQIIDSTANVPQSIDPISQTYAALYERYNQNGAEDYDDLNKHLLARNLNVSDLEAEKLVKGPREEKEPVGADERVHHVETKLNGSSPSAARDDLLDIDKVHYLYNLYKTDQNTSEYLKAWDDADIQELADFMAEVTGDERYSHVMDMTLSQFET